jgi:long-chain acyl-CoA synthetase
MTGKPSIDRPWLKYYPEGADKAPIPEMTAYEYLYERNKDYLDGIALEYYGAKISYAKLFEKIDETAGAFAAQGVKDGDIVTVMMPNTPEAVYCFYALNKIGACANMLSPTFIPEHITGSIDLTETKVLVMLDKFYGMFGEVLEKTKVRKIVITSPLVSLPPTVKRIGSLKQKPVAIPQGEKYMNWGKFIKVGRKQEIIPQATYKKDTPAVIVYSSGSTGASKGIVLPNESFVGLAEQYKLINNLDFNNARGKRALVIVPLFFSTGINAIFNIVMCFGLTAILEPVFSYENFSRNIIEGRPNYLLGSPSYLKLLICDTKFDNSDLSFLEYVISGGELLTEETETLTNSFLTKHNSRSKTFNGWGMCEYGPTVTTSGKADKVGSGCGKPISHIVVGAFSVDTDEELGYNQRGEIRVITPCRMLGYYKNPEATAEFFREGKDGQVWGCSGDMGYIDEVGNVFIEGRATDYIISESGSKVWLFDIESVLLADEAVQLCEAVGLEVDGANIPVAHLVLHQACQEPPETVIRRIHASCTTALPPEAVPRAYKLRDSFNTLPSGKRDTLSLKAEREGYAAVEGGEVREVGF